MKADTKDLMKLCRMGLENLIKLYNSAKGMQVIIIKGSTLPDNRWAENK